MTGNTNMLNKISFLILICLFCPVFANASISTVYIGQSSAGAGDGASCANQKALTFFNTAGNWGAGPSQIGPDTVVHFCGTITTPLAIGGSGTAGHVITFLWESGARISVAHGGIIYLGGATAYLLFDGGIPCGPQTTCNSLEASNLTGYAAGQTGI